MFRLLTRKITTFGAYTKTYFTTTVKQTKMNPMFRYTCLASIPLLMYFNYDIFSSTFKQKESNKQLIQLSTADTKLIENPITAWEKIRSCFSHLWRFLQLVLIFLPPVILFPLKLFKLT